MQNIQKQISVATLTQKQIDLIGDLITGLRNQSISENDLRNVVDLSRHALWYDEEMLREQAEYFARIDDKRVDLTTIRPTMKMAINMAQTYLEIPTLNSADLIGWARHNCLVEIDIADDETEEMG